MRQGQAYCTDTECFDGKTNYYLFFLNSLMIRIFLSSGYPVKHKCRRGRQQLFHDDHYPYCRLSLVLSPSQFESASR